MGLLNIVHNCSLYTKWHYHASWESNVEWQEGWTTDWYLGTLRMASVSLPVKLRRIRSLLIDFFIPKV